MEMSKTLPPSRPSVVVTFTADDRLRDVVDKELDSIAEITYLTGVAWPDRVNALSSAEAALGWGLASELASPTEFAALGSVRLLQVVSAGVDGQLLDLIPAGTPVASNAGAWAGPMAEHVLAMTLALAKHLPERHAEMRSGIFNQRVPNRELRGSIVGIVGFGGIGKATARLIRAFGARIYAITRSGSADEPVDWVGTLDEVDAVLSAADVLVLSIPLNRATRGLIGRRELALMKSDAILVNVARAAIVDLGALVEHLENNSAFSAGIDVWWQEGGGSREIQGRLLELPNVIGSPHNSANTERSVLEAVRLAATNVARALRGEPVEHLVDRLDYVS